MADNKVPDLVPPSARPSTTSEPRAKKPAVALDLGPQSTRMPEGRILEVDDDEPAPDLALDYGPGEVVARPSRAQRVTRVEPPKRAARWPWLLLPLALVGGGAALERTEHGAFFRHKVDALIHAEERALLTQETIDKVRDAFGADTPERGREALALAETALARAPRHKPLLAWAAYTVFAHELRFGRDHERHERALGWLSRAGDHPNAQLAAAARALLHNEPNPAREALTRAPHTVDTMLLLGQLELSSKHPTEAIAAFDEAVKLEPNPRTRGALARALEDVDEKRAAETAAALAEDVKTHVGARLLLGRLAYRAGDQKALERWIAELGPLEKSATPLEKGALFTLRGLHALARGEPVAARAALDESVKLGGSVSSAYTMVGLGELELAAGKAAEARVHYETALTADPRFTRARLGLASTLLALGKLDDARATLDAINDPRFAGEIAKLRARTSAKPTKK